MALNIEIFENITQRVSKNLIKPRQKLFLLRNNIIPKFTHELVLGRVTKGLLLRHASVAKSCIRSVL